MEKNFHSCAFETGEDGIEIKAMKDRGRIKKIVSALLALFSLGVVTSIFVLYSRSALTMDVEGVYAEYTTAADGMNYILLFLMLALIADIYILFFSITRKDNSRSIYFVLLTAAATVYTAGYIIEKISVTQEGVINALRLENLGIPLIAPCFLLISLCLFQPKYVKSWMLPVVGAYGILVFFCVLFNNGHQMYYSKIEFHELERYVYIERGVLYWIQQSIAVLCMIAAYIVLTERFIKGNKKMRRRMVYIVLGALLVFGANVINFMNILPKALDPTPFVMTMVLAFMTINIAKYKLLDIGAIAANTALKTMDDAMIILDNEWCFLSCNDSAKSLFPALESFAEMEPISKIPEWPRELEVAEKLSEIVFDFEGKTPYAPKSTYRANTNKIIDERGFQVGWAIIIRDITSVTFLISQLENLATTDSLTGVANRRSFFEKVQRELDMSARLNISNALLMYDIDFFKKVNDTYGHAAGDHVLCAVVEVIKKRLRSYDIIARYGGEEFVIFMTSISEDSLYKIAYSLCKLIENSEIFYKGTRIVVTASFGAVQMPPGSDLNEAMLAVDEAMYEAKHNGRNQAVVGVIKKSD